MENYKRSSLVWNLIILTNLYMYFLTWVLSAFRILTRTGIIIGWLVFIIGMVIKCRRCLFVIPTFWGKIRFGRCRFLLVLFFLGILLYSWFMPLVNYDSLTYHLPRIMHWIQNQSVQYYVTAIPRQLFNSPLAEYWMLHVYLLTLSEKSYSLVQFGAYMISGYAIWQICGKLGVNEIFSYIALGLWLSSPIVFAEALTTQNDIVAAMWTATGVSYVMDIIAAQGMNFWMQKKELYTNIALLAVCTAFGYLAKGTAPLILAPFWGGLLAIRFLSKKDGFWNIAYMAAGAGITMSVIILPVCVGNFKLWSSPFALENYNSVLIGKFSLKYVIANLIKNLGLHIGGIFGTLNRFLEKIVRGMVGLLGVEFSNDSITFTTSVPYSIQAYYNWDQATVPLLISLFIICCVLLFFIFQQMKTIQKQYAIMCLVSFVIVFGLIKSQPWITRLTIPLLALLCIFVSLVLSVLLAEKSLVFIRTISAAIMVSILFTVFSSAVKLRTPLEDAFRGRFEISVQARAVCQKLQELDSGGRVRKIGLILGADTAEYPIWQSFMDKGGGIPEIRHIYLPDEFKYLEKLEEGNGEFIPDCIVIGGREEYSDVSRLAYKGDIYSRVFIPEDGGFSLYIKTDKK